MTSDFIQQSQTRFRHAPLLIRRIEKTGRGLSRSSLENEGLRRSISATIALLRRAQTLIEKAETRISAQDERIRTLEDLNVIDELTGLYNRRGFTMAFKREIARTQRGIDDGGLLIVVEMDNLQRVAEDYSADVGDSCIKLVSRIIASETRAMDISARVNPGEFILMFSATPTDKALERAQKLAGRLNNLSLIRRGREIQINTSIGLKDYGPESRPEILLPPEVVIAKQEETAAQP
jgi:diguanylate cyclase (GGDEF)-like protein